MCFLSYLGLHLGYITFLMNFSHFYLLYGKSFVNHFDSSIKDKKGKDEKAGSQGDRERVSVWSGVQARAEYHCFLASSLRVCYITCNLCNWSESQIHHKWRDISTYLSGENPVRHQLMLVPFVFPDISITIKITRTCMCVTNETVCTDICHIWRNTYAYTHVYVHTCTPLSTTHTHWSFIQNDLLTNFQRISRWAIKKLIYPLSQMLFVWFFVVAVMIITYRGLWKSSRKQAGFS